MVEYKPGQGHTYRPGDNKFAYSSGEGSDYELFRAGKMRYVFGEGFVPNRQAAKPFRTSTDD